MEKAERIRALEEKIAKLKAEYEAAEWEPEKLRGSGPMLDRFFNLIEASGRTYEEVIEFLEGGTDDEVLQG